MSLTARIAKELIAHEAIVQEAYLDSEDVWTWSVGVTNASGHQVHPRYLDNPQSVERCLEVYIWLLETQYIPDVQAAFSGHALSEAEFGAALSFHYNTGAIGAASWVRFWKAGNVSKAREAIMWYRKPAAIIPRRQKERDLFFNGTWSGNGSALLVPVRKPSYKPNFGAARSINVSAILDDLLDG